jgi:spore germination protein GerM
VISRGRIAGAALVLLALFGIAFFGNRIFTEESHGPAGTATTDDEPDGILFRTYVLYFGDPDSVGVRPERRDALAQGDISAAVQSALEELVNGPLTELVPVMPQGTRIRHVFVGGDGTVYADFNRRLAEGLSGGLSRQSLFLRAVARTLTTNFSTLTRVQVLIDGETPGDLGGHLALDRPLPLAEWSR